MGRRGLVALNAIGRVERDGERVSCSGGGRNGRWRIYTFSLMGLGVASMVGKDEEIAGHVDESEEYIY